MKLLSKDDVESIAALTQQLHPSKSMCELEALHLSMFEYDNYRCFGFIKDGKLVGLSSGWITVRLYSGKQIEIDNFLVDQSQQSLGIGQAFLQEIEIWAKENNCESLELNTYVENRRSHKFYYNLGYAIFGYHFLKRLES